MIATAEHRLYIDADHILADLRERVDQVLVELELVTGWITNSFNGTLLHLTENPNNYFGGCK